MFDAIRQRWRDMGTMKSLCLMAEQLANARGQVDPHAEDFLLSALTLPDGTAQRSFARLQADGQGLRAAIDQQYRDALHHVGITVSNALTIDGDLPAVSPRKMPRAAPSGQALLHAMVHDIKARKLKRQSTAPLLGAHVVLAATAMQRGVVARALQTMRVDARELAKAARSEIDAYRA